MRVALLAPANSVHTVRWANGLAGRGLEVHLITAHEPLPEIDAAVHLHRLAIPAPWAYLLAAGRLARCLAGIRPDLLNVHYASGYGTLARLSAFHPTLVSVWGADVYDFPRISPLHRQLVRSNLTWATGVASTSICMARRVETLCAPRALFVTPFGVDERVFTPGRSAEPGIVIGTVKALAPKYGIDVLLEAFFRVRQRLGNRAAEVRLEITGGGADGVSLQAQAHRLGLQDAVTFHGPVPHARVPAMLHRLDIFVALSRDDSESFGVAAVEAASCGKPVVVSDAEGLSEVTRHGETGFVVPRDDPDAAADAILGLVRDERLREVLGRAGRDHVLRHYTWEHSLDRMIDAYAKVMSSRSTG
jgi:glycosyltransferase involved in cell wall biosynthesis